MGQRSAIAILPQYGYVRMPAAELNERANGDVVLQVLLESAKASPTSMKSPLWRASIFWASAPMI